MIKMLKDLNEEVSLQQHLLSKIMTIVIHSTCYIFFQRNEDWTTDPELMDFYFVFCY